MATWPATLPAPSVAGGYKYKPQPSVLRTDMEIGAPRVRRITTANLGRINLSWVLTLAEKETFWAAYNSASIANAGASWFTLSLRVDGAGFETVEARFVGEPDDSFIPGGYCSITAELEVRK